jgi:hypothetical protein
MEMASVTPLIGAQLDARGADILFKPEQLGGAGDRHNPRPPCQQPGERDLSGCRLLLLGNSLEKINQGLVRILLCTPED